MTTTAPQPTDRLAHFDFASHNAEVKACWAAFNAQHPYRIPTIVGTNTRYFVFNDAANPDHIPFRAFMESPDVMFDQQLRFARWSRFNILQDQELGLPENWTINPDFQNFYEAAWFGCPIEYFSDQVPDTTPAFADNPERVMEHGIPDPFAGIFAKALQYYEHFQARAARETYLGLPIKINPPWCAFGSDGPFTVACNLFSPDFVCEAMLAEPERYHRLIDFITTANIARIAAWRKRFGHPAKQDGGLADDSIALISTETYRQHVLPYHRRILDALATPAPRSIHLCGDSTRHFRTLFDELNIQKFDTGFPVDFAAIRRTLGPTATIQGGPHVDLILRGTPTQVYEESRRILTSGVLTGGRFVLREGNNLAPYTPLDNTEAMYRAGRDFGKLPSPPA